MGITDRNKCTLFCCVKGNASGARAPGLGRRRASGHFQLPFEATRTASSWSRSR